VSFAGKDGPGGLRWPPRRSKWQLSILRGESIWEELCASWVVDDDVPTRVGIRAILGSEPDIEVVGEASTGAEGMELCRALAPDIVLMDVRLPDANGIAVTARIL